MMQSKAKSTIFYKNTLLNSRDLCRHKVTLKAPKYDSLLQKHLITPLNFTRGSQSRSCTTIVNNYMWFKDVILAYLTANAGQNGFVF